MQLSATNQTPIRDLHLPPAPQLRLTHCPCCGCFSRPLAAQRPCRERRLRRPPAGAASTVDSCQGRAAMGASSLAVQYWCVRSLRAGRFNGCVSECESGKISLRYLPVRHLISSIPRKFFFFFLLLSHLIVSQQSWSFLVFILQSTTIGTYISRILVLTTNISTSTCYSTFRNFNDAK